MATNTVTAKLRLRLELIAALPEQIMLDRLRRLSVAELIVFRRFYGIPECRCARAGWGSVDHHIGRDRDGDRDLVMQGSRSHWFCRVSPAIPTVGTGIATEGEVTPSVFVPLMAFSCFWIVAVST